jgi:hypothetical protein
MQIKFAKEPKMFNRGDHFRIKTYNIPSNYKIARDALRFEVFVAKHVSFSYISYAIKDLKTKIVYSPEEYYFNAKGKYTSMDYLLGQRISIEYAYRTYTEDENIFCKKKVLKC